MQCINSCVCLGSKMSNGADFHMAMLLQQQFDSEFSVENPGQDLTYSYQKKKKQVAKKSPSTSSKCLIDPSWELVDPTPNIHILFVQFSQRFFWNKLLAVTVSWSKRMTSCAGICSYQGRGGMCSITLSEPLLKLRPRKDFVETLLHEMIHAYLFVTHNNRDRDGHGPEFHSHMHRINGEAGTNITVYHNFHDEVMLYKQHWWRCEGQCQKKPPFFGMLRRAMNRAPGPNDRWWADHQLNCGGKFIKVKEPEKKTTTVDKKSAATSKGSQSNKENSFSNLPDIRNFLPGANSSSNKHTNATKNTKIQTINSVKGTRGNLGVKNANGTVVINSKSTKPNDKNSDLGISSVISTISNIVEFTNSNSQPSTSKNNTEAFSGTGKKLSNNSTQPKDMNAVKNHWANKFPSTPSSSTSTSKNQTTNKRKSPNSESTSTKKQKIPNTSNVNCPNCNKLIQKDKLNSHIDFCLNTDQNIRNEFSDDSATFVKCPVCSENIDEKLLNEHLDNCLININKSNIVPKPTIKVTKPKENTKIVKNADVTKIIKSGDNNKITENIDNNENTGKNKRRSKTPETTDSNKSENNENVNKPKRRSKTPENIDNTCDKKSAENSVTVIRCFKTSDSKTSEQSTDNTLTTIRCFTSSGNPQVRSLENINEASESNHSLISKPNTDTKKSRRKSEGDKNINETKPKERRKSTEKLDSTKNINNDKSLPSSSSCKFKCVAEKTRSEKDILAEKLAAQEYVTKIYSNVEVDFDIPPNNRKHVLCLVCYKQIEKSNLDMHLEDCAGSAFNEEQSEDMDTDENESESEENKEAKKNVEYNCPICMLAVGEDIMNRHIDECLNAAVLQNENFLD